MDQRGQAKALRPQDVLVVAPYNDQVDLLRARLDGPDEAAGVAAGTVDNFQGSGGRVVFFTAHAGRPGPS